MASSFLDRFRQLEIPEAKRRIDWSFLDEPLALPAPLPLQELALVGVVEGRVWEPVDRAPASNRIRFYGAPAALDERGAAAEHEARWLTAHATELARQGKRFLDAIPTEILRERADEALDILQLNAPTASLLEGQRLLRLHDKLYNLLTLHEYTRIFEKAIEPDCFVALQALPATCSPEEMLAQIEASLPKIHKKARSPLRNKMECTRLVLDGVTLLPVYREPTAGLFSAYHKVLERRIKIGVLQRHVAR